MVAIGAGGLSPGRFFSRLAAWLRTTETIDPDPQGKKPHYPPQRASFVEQASMSREMYRL